MKTRNSGPPAQQITMSLRTLNDEEMQQAYDQAHHAGILHMPTNLRAVWTQRKGMAGAEGIKELVRMLRRGANAHELDEPEPSALLVATLVKMAVERFELLVQDGVLDSVLPRLTALPVLYSTKAGKGSPEWQWARDLFEDKKVGTDAAGGHRGSSSTASRNPNWGILAAEAARVAYYATIKLAEFDAMKERAVAVGRKVARRPGAHYAWSGTLYLLDDESVLVWPDWLELCRGLPKAPKKDVPRYKKACTAIAQEFFGDPGNEYAEKLIATKTSSQNGISRARARLEAVQAVVAAVTRL